MTEKKISCGDLPRLLLFYNYLTFLSDPWDMCLLCCALGSESVLTNLSCRCCRWNRDLWKRCACVLLGDRCDVFPKSEFKEVFSRMLYDLSPGKIAHVKVLLSFKKKKKGVTSINSGIFSYIKKHYFDFKNIISKVFKALTWCKCYCNLGQKCIQVSCTCDKCELSGKDLGI